MKPVRKGDNLTKRQIVRIKKIKILFDSLHKERIEPILLSSSLVFVRNYNFDNLEKDTKYGGQINYYNTNLQIVDCNP